jgi:toxin ParE1/3/4
MKLLTPSVQADKDARDAFTYFTNVADENLGFAFIDQLDAAFLSISENPQLGSPRIGEKYHLAGLRSWRLAQFNAWSVYYIDRPEFIDVIRVLHSRRDLRSVLSEEHQSK